MRSALSEQGTTLRQDEILTRLEARTTVAEFMTRTGPLGKLQEVDPIALGVEEVEKQ